MSHSLRAKLSGLRHKGILEDKDYKRLCHALDLEKAEQEQISPCEDSAKNCINNCFKCEYSSFYRAEQEPCDDVVSRQAVLKTLDDMDNVLDEDRTIENYKELLKECYEVLPSVRPQEQTYTEDELKEFADGISLRLCSLKSAEYWVGKYTEQIAWLEQLYEKVKADMRGAE